MPLRRTPVKNSVCEQSSKRKITELSPDNVGSVQNTQVGKMDASELMGLMGALLDQKLDDKLKNMPTKADLEIVTEKLTEVSAEVASLRAENELLKGKLKQLEQQWQADRREVARVVDFQKRCNIIVRGLDKGNGPMEAAKALFDQLGAADVIIKSSKIIYEHNNKIGIAVEVGSVDMVQRVLRSSKKLAGTSISLEKDLSPDRQLKRRMMVQIKSEIMKVDRSHKIKVRNDRINIGNVWLFWNRDNVLIGKDVSARAVFENTYGDKLNNIDFSYSSVLDRAQKNRYTKK